LLNSHPPEVKIPAPILLATSIASAAVNTGCLEIEAGIMTLYDRIQRLTPFR